jgi:threonine dehydrogenase-like Zn-dependent dehydrogenase
MMRAALTRGGQIVVDDVPKPEPGAGQVLVRSLACGICGSDLHALEHFDEFVNFSSRSGGVGPSLQRDRDVVFGHEFCAEIVEYGPNTSRNLGTGTKVCSVPMALGPRGPELIGYSHDFPGGFAEFMVLQEMMLRPVPDGVLPEHAALTEPMAVGEHAVARGNLACDDVCVVIGCGPVGLAVIAALKARGHGPVMAADFSPMRRQLAAGLGADEVIDPAQDTPYSRWDKLGVPSNMLARTMAEMGGSTPRNSVIFESVGAPGILQSIIEGAPPRSRVVVVGVCMKPDTIEPMVAIGKELDVRFSFGYSAEEFSNTLLHIADGTLAVAPLVTGRVGLDDVAGAFRSLNDPDEHAKIIVQPNRQTEPKP